MRIKHVLAVITLVLFFTNAAGQNNFAIKGSFQQYNGLLYLEYSGLLDSVEVKDGQFEFSGIIDIPVKANFKVKSLLHLSYTPFIIDPAVLVVKVDTAINYFDKVANLTVRAKVLSGGASTGKVNKFRQEIKNRILAAGDQGERSKILVDGVYDFMRSNPNDQFAALWIVGQAISNFPVEDLKEIYSRLDLKMRSTSYGQEIKNKIDKQEMAIVGTLIADFQQFDINQKALSIKSMRGKYVLIDFWSSWCIPCREENPNLLKLYRRYKAKGFDILSVSLDTNRGLWEQAVKKDKLLWSHVSDLKGFNNDVAALFKIKSIPSNILIDKEGIIIAKDLRGEALSAALEKVFN